MTPKKVRVLNYDYKITQKPGLGPEAGHDGFCDAHKKEIVIDKDLEPKEKLRVLVHEMIHALQFESGLCEILDHQALEMTAETMAGFLTAVFELKFKRN